MALSIDLESVKSAAARILGSKAASCFVFQAADSFLTKNNHSSPHDGVHDTSHCSQDTFRLEDSGGRILIQGDSGVSMLAGLNWYLKHHLDIHISWNTPAPEISLPLPPLGQTVAMTTPYRCRYYLNYCTFSYTMAFWDWDRWEKELDLMALGGINMALNLVGQEAVWMELLTRLGMGREQARNYLTGPVHLAWFFLGNMTRFGAALTDKWLEERLELGRKISRRMLSLGITPVLPGYYGMLPQEIRQIYPDARLLSQGDWCGFERPCYIHNEDPLFHKAGILYYEVERELFGSITPYFTAEPFHEGGNPDGFHLPDYGRDILELMQSVRPDAVWVLQAWDSNPYLELFEAVPRDRVLILNLLSGRIQQGSRITGEFGGLPWVWCPVHSYGGRNSMYGFLRTLAREPVNLIHRQGTSLCGIGLAPESLETNPVFYDLFWDIIYRQEPVDTRDWLKGYVTRRYGGFSETAYEAWLLLEDSVYNSFVPQPGGAESFLCARPDFQLTSVSTWGPKQVNYDTVFVRRAAVLLFQAFEELKGNENYLYDLVDVTRQALSNISRVEYAGLMYLLSQRRYEAFRNSSRRFLLLLETQEELLSACPAFSAGSWLDQARECGSRYGMEKECETAARLLVTVWGTRSASESLHDYSCREWSGLTGGFYYGRWQHFFQEIEEWLAAGKELDLSASLSRDWASSSGEASGDCFHIDWYQWEMDWVSTAEIPVYVKSDVKTAVQKALDKFILDYD